MTIVSRWRTKAARRPSRVVLADTTDQRAIDAAAIVNTEGFAEAVVVDAGPGLQLSDAVKERAAGLRQPPDLDDPLSVATLMVACGEADACIAGASRPTADVIRAGLRILGMSSTATTVSSSFFFVLPDHGVLADDPRRHVVYGDCGVLPDPDATELASVAIDSAKTFAQLTGQTPKVAMLSFSTKGSAEHARVDKVREATEIVRDRAPDLEVDGELQFDAAWDLAVGSSKAPRSEVAGQANVFIFPDLSSGNIAYKITERLTGAQAFGPLLQGLDGIMHDLSRGCSVDDIVNVAAIAAVQSASRLEHQTSSS